ncbi:MAG: putative signal transduction protein [Acidimicrobiia bacterium]|nr:putative signal transduction protein [Acidimicrobiia bacterium]
MAIVYCNNCGHRNPQESNFCSSCGALLDKPPASDPSGAPAAQGSDERTITFHPADGGQESQEADDVDVVVDFDPSGAGTGVLVVRNGPEAGLKVPLVKPVTRAGRHPKSELFLDDITVSRRHAEIERTGDSYVLVDVGSLNGTYLNRQRIERQEIHSGDELQIGKFRLVFLAGTEQEA